jgi:hypothetical protein
MCFFRSGNWVYKYYLDELYTLTSSCACHGNFFVTGPKYRTKPSRETNLC